MLSNASIEHNGTNYEGSNQSEKTQYVKTK